MTTVMNTLKTAKITLLALLLAALAACGEGGNNSASNKSFSVQLSSVKVQRLSNGAAVSIDTSDANSGTLQYSH